MHDVFSLPPVRFPADFLWGSSTAGHQIEGDNVNSQRWKAELENVGNWFESPSGKACNHWELYREDVELLKQLGHQAYRLSVEWSRIEPQEGKYDEQALAKYLDLLGLLKAAGIKVFLTLHHATHPQWFEEKGGFKERENLQYFERHINYLVPKIAAYVDFWNVINEFNLNGIEWNELKANMVLAHARGYHIIKQYSQAPVSTAHAFTHMYPMRLHDKFDNIMRDFKDWYSHEFFFHVIRTGELILPFREMEIMPEAKGAIDYWSINCYTRNMVNSRAANLKGERYRHAKMRMIDQDFYLEEFYAEGMIANLERLKDYPVYITENGCSCDDDRFRVVWIAEYLCALREAMDRGVDVRGYLYWSTMDNYEWSSFKPRFGMVDVDFETFKRTPKPSSAFFKEIIERDGFDRELVKKYLPDFPVLKTYCKDE
jgi:beta-glucosidase